MGGEGEGGVCSGVGEEGGGREGWKGVGGVGVVCSWCVSSMCCVCGGESGEGKYEFLCACKLSGSEIEIVCACMWEGRGKGKRENHMINRKHEGHKDRVLQCSVFHVRLSFPQACVPLGVVVWRRAGEW